MEIRTDLSAPVQLRALKNQIHGTQNQAPTIDAGSQMQPGMREFANALSIMQTASAIIQQALTISGKLHDIAVSTMSTGRTDTQELTNSIAEIKGSIQQQGQAQSIIQPFVQNSPQTRDVLPADKEIEDLGKMAESGKPDKARLDEIRTSLEEKNRALTSRMEETAGRMGAVGFRYEATPIPVADMTKTIVNNSAAALTAQGNVRVENANRALI